MGLLLVAAFCDLLLLGQFRSDGFQEFVPGLFEFLHAFGFQNLEHVVQIDPEGLEGGEHLGGPRVGAVDGVAADHSVVADGVNGLFRGGVHGVRGDKLDDVFAVLESEGVEKFEQAWNELLESVSQELAKK